jgi:hypothetical protein
MGRTLFLLVLLVVGWSAFGIAQGPMVINDVIKWGAKSETNPDLGDWKGVLTFDDGSKVLSFEAGKHSFKTGYDGVSRIVFEEGTHMRPRRTAWAQWEMQSKRINGNYWMYVELPVAGKPPAAHMLEINRESATAVLEKAKAVFADRVMVTDVRVGAYMDRKALKDLDSKHDFKMQPERKDAPRPALKPDKGLIVVVYPEYDAYDSTSLINLKLKHHNAGEMLASQVKIHVNDRVVLVNKVGTYGFFYLDSGDYQIVAQGKYSGSALQLTVEAGKAYYFLEDDFDSSPGGDMQLSQHSPELVMHQLGPAYFGVWARKEK